MLIGRAGSREKNEEERGMYYLVLTQEIPPLVRDLPQQVNTDS